MTKNGVGSARFSQRLVLEGSLQDAQHDAHQQMAEIVPRRGDAELLPMTSRRHVLDAAEVPKS